VLFLLPIKPHLNCEIILCAEVEETSGESLMVCPYRGEEIKNSKPIAVAMNGSLDNGVVWTPRKIITWKQGWCACSIQTIWIIQTN
jgi:hypothetical protein